MKKPVAVVTLLFALSVIALAHGKGKHVMGTVTNISDSSITVQTTTKELVTVGLNDKTKFQKSGSPANLKDLKVGDRVVVHTDTAGDKLIANEVQFGAQKGKQSMHYNALHERYEGHGFFTRSQVTIGACRTFWAHIEPEPGLVVADAAGILEQLGR